MRNAKQQNDSQQDGSRQSRRSGTPSRLPAFAAIILVIIGQWWMASVFILRPIWLFPLISGVLLAVSVAFYLSPKELDTARRAISVGLASIFVVINIGVLVILIYNIFAGSSISPIILLASGGVLWVINVLVFAIVYWEVDCGGLERRINRDYSYPDFVFPQQQDGSAALAPQGWEPSFYDYLYLSLTNGTAFSPTDTMPYTSVAKFMMGAQSLFSFVVFTILVASSVNIATS